LGLRFLGNQQHKAASLRARRGWMKKYDANKANRW
jgi:hypothetical protein